MNRRLIAFLGVISVAILTLAAFVSQPMVTSVPSTAPPVDPARLEAHVKKLSVDFYPRSFEHRANLERTAAYIEGQFKEAGAQVTIQEVVVEGERYKNVVARFGPAHGRLLVIGAHYDSHGKTPGAPSIVQGVDFSDHRSYWAQGYPARMVTDTAFMRNRTYHGAGDTFDKLDYKRMAMVVQTVYAVAKSPET